MKRLFILSICILIINNAFGQTINFSGNVDSSIIWDVDTVKILGDVTVLDSVTLTISPGVYVEFQADYFLKVEGRLLAEGTESAYITFSIDDTTDSWRSIKFDSISNNNDTSKLSYCIIEHSSNSYGGGVFVRNSHKLIIDHSILRNNTSSLGGAIYIANSDICISNALICENGVYSWGLGGGLHLKSSDVLLKNNRIINNYTGYDGAGGGIYSSYSNPLIINNVIQNNMANFDPGIALHISDAVIINTLIADNYIENYRGCGIMSQDSDFVLINSTVCSNSQYYTSYDAFAGLILLRSSPTIVNSILYYNHYFDDPIQVFIIDSTSVPDFYNCNIQGGLEGFSFGSGVTYTGNYINNISAEPLFVDLDNRDYTLQEGSPCINTGMLDTTGLDLPAFDLNQNNRIVSDTVDIGAYEYQIPLSSESIDLLMDNIKFYPNPVKEELYIENEAGTFNQIEIYDMKGELLLNLSSKAVPIILDLKQLSRGIYLLKVNSTKQSRSKLFVKQ